jgi:hypothetical protein
MRPWAPAHLKAVGVGDDLGLPANDKSYCAIAHALVALELEGM